MTSPKSHPHFKYYMGTDDIEDLVSFSKTPAGRMEKRIKQEAEALRYLELQRSQAKDTLMDEQRIQSDIQIPRRYLEKLEAAADKYEQAISDLIINDTNLKMAYISKLTQQLKLTDSTLVKLWTIISFFDNRTAHVSACIQAKVCSKPKAIESNMNIILNAYKEEDMSSSIPKIMVNLQLLEDVVTNAAVEQDVIHKQIAQENITKADAVKFLHDNSQLVDVTRETVTQLCPNLIQAAAVIYEEVKAELKGEKVKEAMETEFTPELKASFLPKKQHVAYLSPTQTAHYAREKTTE